MGRPSPAPARQPCRDRHDRGLARPGVAAWSGGLHTRAAVGRCEGPGRRHHSVATGLSCCLAAARGSRALSPAATAGVARQRCDGQHHRANQPGAGNGDPPHGLPAPDRRRGTSVSGTSAGDTSEGRPLPDRRGRDVPRRPRNAHETDARSSIRRHPGHRSSCIARQQGRSQPRRPSRGRSGCGLCGQPCAADS